MAIGRISGSPASHCEDRAARSCQQKRADARAPVATRPRCKRRVASCDTNCSDAERAATPKRVRRNEPCHCGSDTIGAGLLAYTLVSLLQRRREHWTLYTAVAAFLVYFMTAKSFASPLLSAPSFGVAAPSAAPISIPARTGPKSSSPLAAPTWRWRASTASRCPRASTAAAAPQEVRAYAFGGTEDEVVNTVGGFRSSSASRPAPALAPSAPCPLPPCSTPRMSVRTAGTNRRPS